MASIQEAGDRPPPFTNRPEEKLPPLPKGSRLQKRPLPGLSITRQPRNGASNNPRTTNPDPGPDVDGYRIPPRAAHTMVIKVSSKTPFMAIVRRARAALDNGPQKMKGLPLMARIAALGVREGRGKEELRGPVTDALDDVVLVGTGKAIQRALEVGCFFRRNKDLTVVFRTRSVAAIDDIVMDDEDVDEEDQVRLRHMSCVEVGIRWAR